MKTKSASPRALLFVTLASLLGASLIATSQPSPNEKQGGNRPAFRGDRPQGGFQPGGPQGQFFPMLQRVLTEDQRASLRDAMEDQREKMRDIEGKLRDARKALLQASVVDKFDEDAVRKQALEVGKLDAELTVIRAKAFSKIKPPLSAEQLEQIKSPPPFDGAENRGEYRRPGRAPAGPRDENDLPLPPKPDK